MSASKIRLPVSPSMSSVAVGRAKEWIYADNAATTAIRPEALRAYTDTCRNAYGNPSSSHAPGRAARDALEWARKEYAHFMSVPPSTVIFTSCGTESNNIALRGVFSYMNKMMHRTMIVTSSIEHSSIRKTAELVAGKGNHLQAEVDSKGYVDVDKFRELLQRHSSDIAMISIILAQNEVGTIQRIPTLVRIAREVLGPLVPFHTDATQAFGKYYISPEALGVDLLTASSHKYHGPRGVGILYAKPNVIDPEVTPMTGGGQEHGCRSGTENVPAIVASAVALRAMLGDSQLYNQRKKMIFECRNFLLATLRGNIPDLKVNGDPERGLYGLISVSLPDCLAADIVKRLDQQGIAVGSGSACNKGRPSETMLKMGKTPEEVLGTIRISLSEHNTPDQCRDIAVAVVRAWNQCKGKRRPLP